jgi:multicomponent Na+:H+ antiporter subunit B
MIKRLAALLLLAVLGPLFANLLVGYTPDPALNPTALYYAERTAQDLGAANLVTAIVISYRGLDTLGEVTVLFLAAAIVGLVLAGPGARQGSKRKADAGAEPGANDQKPARLPPAGRVPRSRWANC